MFTEQSPVTKIKSGDTAKNLQNRLREIQEEEERVQKEIEELESKIAANDSRGRGAATEMPASSGKRNFLKVVGGLIVAGAGAVAAKKVVGVIGELNKAESAMPKTPHARHDELADLKTEYEAKQESADSKAETELSEHPVQREIEKCRQIIQNEQYEEIIKSPYLVSALYYSEQGMRKMGPPYKHKSEKIVATIYPLITKKFRENYIKYLEKIAAENSDGINFNVQTELLDTLSLGKDIEKNHLDAVDLFVKEGSPIYSMAGGVVVLAENNWNLEDDMSTSSHRGGNAVIIFNPPTKSFYRYAHMEHVQVSAGKVIPAGKRIGIVGHSGINASKPGHGKHVHFEINTYDPSKGIMVPVYVFKLKKRLLALKP